ncbi:conjugal transfer protein TraB [Candidatus Bathyarchaeota archaeon]|nr:conjugal transfer protein TraB [Candidatus Bathyarchaeota archaeon]|tara:strand:+ start:281 stop:1450 length:1170 start_codon:yes stop_codon:yes gene_type:complete
MIRTITIGSTRITLAGTAHVSKASADLVAEMIASDEYDCVAVELCESRYKSLFDDTVWKNLDIFQVFRRRQAGMLLLSLALASYQSRLANRFGIQAGQEFRIAITEAQNRGLRLELVDRDVRTTLNRVAARVPWWQRISILSGLLGSAFSRHEIEEAQIEELKQGDMLKSVMEEFGTTFPGIREALIDERDRYMIGKLAAITEAPSSPKHILAVVGAGHVQGMEQYSSKPPNEASMEELMTVPPKSQVGLYIGWAIVAIILSAFAVGYSRSPELGLSMLLTWVLINGSLCALGVVIARGHPLTVLSGFFAAPLTSLNPTIGAGMVTGAVEAWIRKPKVSDFESLRTDLTHVRKWWTNGVSRVLLVFFFGTLGSALGTYIAGAKILSDLF